MGKVVFLFVSLALTMLAYAPHSVHARTNSDNITITIDGSPVIFEDVQPLIVNGRVLVPVRAVFEKMGFSVDMGKIEVWMPNMILYAPAAVLSNDDVEIRLKIDSNWIHTVGVSMRYSVVNAQIYNGRLLVPLRIIAEIIGSDADWDRNTRTASIKTNPSYHQETVLKQLYIQHGMIPHQFSPHYDQAIISIFTADELDTFKSNHCFLNRRPRWYPNPWVETTEERLRELCVVCSSNIFYQYTSDFFAESSLVFLFSNTNRTPGGFSHIYSNGNIVFAHGRCTHGPIHGGIFPIAKVFEIRNSDMPASFAFSSMTIDNFQENCSECFYHRYGIRVPWEEWDYHGFTS